MDTDDASTDAAASEHDGDWWDGDDLFDDEVRSADATSGLPDIPDDVTSPPTVQSVLNSASPLVLVTQPHQGAKIIPDLIRRLASAHAGKVDVGVIAPMTRIRANDGARYLDSCGAASVRIADPMTYATFNDVPGRKRLTRTSWLFQQRGANLLGGFDDESWTTAVVTDQRTAGANIILSPAPWLSGKDPQKELDRAFEFSSFTENSLKSGEHMATNLTLDIRWLTHDRLRDDLLERINEEGPDILYVRVLWSKPDVGGQPCDVSLVAGYRELSEVARAEGICLLLPDTDLTGWLSTAWGARGFGTGIASGARAFTPSGGGGSGLPPRERILVSELLHTILRTEQVQAVSAGLVSPCTCPYCTAVANGESWSSLIQGMHHVWSVADITARHTGPSAAQSAVNSAVTTASAVAAQIPLERSSRSPHLSLWQQVFSAP